MRKRLVAVVALLLLGGCGALEVQRACDFVPPSVLTAIREAARESVRQGFTYLDTVEGLWLVCNGVPDCVECGTAIINEAYGR